MKTNVLLVSVAVVAASFLWVSRCAAADPEGMRVVRLAELEIDAARLDAYEAALKEEIEASVRMEPGVLTLYAVAVRGHPEQIRLFEMYASPAAYEAHLKSPHFLKYKAATQGMVKSLRLVETEPVILESKFK